MQKVDAGQACEQSERKVRRRAEPGRAVADRARPRLRQRDEFLRSVRCKLAIDGEDLRKLGDRRDRNHVCERVDRIFPEERAIDGDGAIGGD